MKIEELLKRACEAYYSGDLGLMSDETYDRLAAKYKYEAIGAPQGGENTAKHLYPMYSLKKYFVGEGELPETFRSPDCVTSLKLDGAAVALYYIYGNFSHALTRGDGEIGQIIDPDKFQIIKNVPKTLAAFAETPILQVSGEVVASKDIPNSRNYVSGALNLKDSIADKQPMYFFAYSLQPNQLSTYIEDMLLLETLGFASVMHVEPDKFKTDGNVLRINSNAKFQELGYTNHHPRGALAVKQRKDGVVTKLLDVVWQVGKSGRVTPVAVLEPVLIDGAKISRATLNNADFIRTMGLCIGDMVEVIRSGDIIPTIVGKADDI